jgi:ABC-type thiamine transport system ATPase subunit
MELLDFRDTECQQMDIELSYGQLSESPRGRDTAKILLLDEPFAALIRGLEPHRRAAAHALRKRHHHVLRMITSADRADGCDLVYVLAEGRSFQRRHANGSVMTPRCSNLFHE